MADIQYSVDRYTIEIKGNVPVGYWRRTIYLWTWGCSDIIGEFRFVEDGEKLPVSGKNSPVDPNRPEPPPDVILTYFHVSEFPDLVDTLRNEGPLYIRYNEAGDFSYLGTATAPAGD